MKNAEHYNDPTPTEALENISKEERAVGWICRVMKEVAKIGGFEVIGRIILRSLKSGSTYK